MKYFLSLRSISVWKAVKFVKRIEIPMMKNVFSGQTKGTQSISFVLKNPKNLTLAETKKKCIKTKCQILK